MKTTNKALILSAAQKVFAQNGFEKTTMNDIAREAGVARQTVYNAFENKDMIFVAFVRQRLDSLRQELQQAWAADQDVPSFLDTFLRLVPISWFDETSAVPDPAALIDRLHRVADAELQAFAADVIGQISARLSSCSVFEGKNQLSPVNVAEGFYWGTVNAKYNAPDRDAFMRRIAATRAMTLAILRLE